MEIDCSQHGRDCKWYWPSPKYVGAALGYGDGVSAAQKFADSHNPTEELPVYPYRQDDYAIGFLIRLGELWNAS